MSSAQGEAGRYFLPPDYVSHPSTAYFPDVDDGVVWQPDVYLEAGELAKRLGASRIIDLGCGEGRKLVTLHPAFDIVGVDHEANLAACRRAFAFGTWIEHDLESEAPLPFVEAELREAVIVCSDVIEHLLEPGRLLRMLRRGLDHARAVVLSTPERGLTHGASHRGPPPNRSHVREWALDEFRALLAASGFEHAEVGLTRSNDKQPLLRTILAICYQDRRAMLRGKRRLS